MIDQTRRKLLKTIAYGTALSATVASASAFALASSKNTSATNEGITGLNIFQQQADGKEIVSLMNLTNEAITLDGNAPVSFQKMNDSLMISMNAANDSKGVTLQAGERFMFEVEAVDAYAKLSSDHLAFNGVMAIAA